ncbi:MAG: FAD binding domain-containing protein [Thaumarchaeota archaeon]|nr:FAD binding domain-containing protein [Nitrososphaerota archaeon]
MVVEEFAFLNPRSIAEAVSLHTKYGEDSRFFAGGTNLLYMMKRGVRKPRYLINLKTIRDLDLTTFDDTQGLRIGSLTTIESLENSKLMKEKFPILAQAAKKIASPQIRYMATVGGNLCQDVWCWYLLEDFPCWLNGGEYCFAPEGDNRYHHSVLGGYFCFAVHPSDLATAFCALDATLVITGGDGTKEISLESFLPGFTKVEGQLRQNILKGDEILTEIRVAPRWQEAKGVFVKYAVRQSFDFALSSAAVTMRMENDRCADVRIVIGGIAPLPFRARQAEAVLIGKRLDKTLLEDAVEQLFGKTIALSGNAYRIQISKDLVAKALGQLSFPYEEKFIAP